MHPCLLDLTDFYFWQGVNDDLLGIDVLHELHLLHGDLLLNDVALHQLLLGLQLLLQLLDQSLLHSDVLPHQHLLRQTLLLFFEEQVNFLFPEGNVLPQSFLFELVVHYSYRLSYWVVGRVLFLSVH